MTSAPDAGDVSDPTLPRDPADYAPPRRPIMGPAFWAAIIIGLVLIGAGAIIGFFGARLFPAHPTGQASAATAPATGEPASTPSPPSPVELPGGAAAIPAAPPGVIAGTAPSPAELTALAGRVDRLQSDQRRVTQASAEALAAADLSETAQGSLPFADALSRLDRLLPDSADLRTLRALAQAGAPSRAALAAEFTGLADRAAVASHAPPPGSSVLARVAHALSAIFTLRRIDRVTGTGPDAVLARAQRRADDGDIEGALKELAALPPAGQQVLAGWRSRALRRAEIDRITADIRAGAVRDLAQAAGPGPTS